jgi:hypothetical protein
MPFKSGNTKRGLLARSQRCTFQLWLKFHIAPLMLCRLYKKCVADSGENRTAAVGF